MKVSSDTLYGVYWRISDSKLLPMDSAMEFDG